MDTTTMTQVATDRTRRDRLVRPEAARRLLAPLCVADRGTTLPTGSGVAYPAMGGAVSGAIAPLSHPTTDDSSFRRGRPPV